MLAPVQLLSATRQNLWRLTFIRMLVLAAQAGAEQADKVLRAYRLYLAGSALGFERGWMALHQMLAIKPDGDTARGLLPGAQ